jgi:hypothetical protein
MQEERANREGYLEFKLRIEQGDVKLHSCAAQEWHDDPDHPQTTRARYFQLFAAERRLDSLFCSTERERLVGREADQQMLRLRSEALRQATGTHVASRMEYWRVGRFRETCNYLEVHEGDVKDRALQREAAHPGESEPQSWFHAKQEAVDAHLDRLCLLEKKARRDIQRIIEAAVTRERRAPAREEQRIDLFVGAYPVASAMRDAKART